jgi:hypothetical protein
VRVLWYVNPMLLPYTGVFQPHWWGGGTYYSSAPVALLRCELVCRSQCGGSVNNFQAYPNTRLLDCARAYELWVYRTGTAAQVQALQYRDGGAWGLGSTSYHRQGKHLTSVPFLFFTRHGSFISHQDIRCYSLCKLSLRSCIHRPTASSVNIRSFASHLSEPREDEGAPAPRLHPQSEHRTKALQTILNEDTDAIYLLRRCDIMHRVASEHRGAGYANSSSIELHIK